HDGRGGLPGDAGPVQRTGRVARRAAGRVPAAWNELLEARPLRPGQAPPPVARARRPQIRDVAGEGPRAGSGPPPFTRDARSPPRLHAPGLAPPRPGAAPLRERPPERARRARRGRELRRPAA